MATAKNHRADLRPESTTDLLELSPALFKLRRTLLEQFSRMERELQSKYSDHHEKFVSRDEFELVIHRMLDFRNEMESLLVGMEDRIQTTVGNISHNMKKLSQDLSQPAIKPNMSKNEQTLDDFLADLNPFNMRRKYHEFSLKLRSEEVDPFGFDPIFDRFFKPLFDFLYTKYWRVETFGIENIPEKGPCLMVGNHSGCLPYDATMLKTAIAREHSQHRELRFMVEDFLFHFPFLGSLMSRFGGVRASQENAERLLDAGMPVVVFPEGVKGLGKLYRDRYHLARFGRGGFVRLCLRTGAPLVPVAFIGPEEIHPMLYKETKLAALLGAPYIPITPTFPFFGPLGLVPLPSKWSIHILPQIDFSSYGPGAEKDRVLVYKMSQRVKEQIQDTIVDKLKERRSIWFG